MAKLNVLGLTGRAGPGLKEYSQVSCTLEGAYIKIEGSNGSEYQIRRIMKQNRDGSPDRQLARHQNLMRCVRQIRSWGYDKRWDVHWLDKEAPTSAPST